MNYIRDESKYPQLYIPISIERIYNLLHSDPVKPNKPVKPTKPIEPEISIQGNSSTNKNRWGRVLFFGVVGFIIASISLFSGWSPIISLISMLFFWLLPISLSYINSCKEESDRLKYKTLMTKYEEELSEFPNIESRYEKECEEYEKQLIAYYDKLRMRESPKYIEKNKRSILKNLTKLDFNKLKIKQCEEEAIKDVSDSFFFRHLTKIADIEIYTTHKVKAGETFYYPDFLIQDRISGFFYNIEIDEPYNESDGKPTHYNDENGYSIDKEWNDFFTNSNCIVIRFAEEQIFKYPTLCLDFIREIMEKTVSVDLDSIEIDSKLIIDKWTKNDAVFMYEKHVN